MSNIFIGLKKRLVLGVLNRGDRDTNNKADLKEGGGRKISTTVLPYTRWRREDE